MKKIPQKKIFFSLMLMCLTLCFTNCMVSHHHHHHHKSKKLPPGHAKKITGEKSAKRHARGRA